MKVAHIASLALYVLGVAPASCLALRPRALPPQLARDVASPSQTSAPPADPTICGDIIDSVNNGSWYFYALDAHDCLTSVPFNPAVAQRFLDYFNTTMQFQSTLAYLRNPTAGYQQPAVDVEQLLRGISANITAGRYQNEYDFEADVMQLVIAIHDTHVQLSFGAMAAFTFGSGFSIVSASTDGVQPPKIYVQDDIVQRNFGYNISAISMINGEPVVDFLERLAAKNSVGTVEPHADWNQLMYSPVLSILERPDVFSEGLTFYPGDELDISFENGTDSISINWLAVYTVPSFTGPLTTGGDFYNFFVLGNIPASYDQVPLPCVFNLTIDCSFNDANNDTVNNTVQNSLSNWNDTTDGAYPSNPFVVQENLQTGVAGGVVTGYLLKDLSTSVLSIPSFDELGYDIGNFSNAVIEFIRNSTENGVDRILIDLQGNLGGQALLAFDTFGHFFPNIKPFAGSRRRSHPLANVVGNTITTYWSNLPSTNSSKITLEDNEWVITDRIDAATGQNFSSWPQYYGPLEENSAYFSLVEQYDLTNINFQDANLDDWDTNIYLAAANVSATPPFNASQIVILTDGQCASTCTLFVEMMTHQAGVRTIVVGGQPRAGPMQAASGTRGARLYGTDLLDEDFSDTNVFSQNSTTALVPLLDPDTGTRDSGIASYLSINLRDQVRAATGSPNVPLQFTYLAADCRIYFTLESVMNVTQLWSDAVGAMWLNSSRCVANSTGYSSSHGSSSALPPPARPAHPFKFSSASSSLQYNGPKDDDYEWEADPDGGLVDEESTIPMSGVRRCDDNYGPCSHQFSCQQVLYKCAWSSSSPIMQKICVPTCESTTQSCGMSHMTCQLAHSVQSSDRTVGLGGGARHNRLMNVNKRIGTCTPTLGSAFRGIGCDYDPNDN